MIVIKSLLFFIRIESMDLSQWEEPSEVESIEQDENSNEDHPIIRMSDLIDFLQPEGAEQEGMIN